MKNCFFHYFLLHIVLLSALISAAQKPIWSEPMKWNRDIRSVKWVGASDSNFIFVEENKKEKGFKFNSFSLNDLTLKSSAENQIPENENEIRIEQIVQLKEKILMFTSTWNKVDEKLQVFCTSLGVDGNKKGDAILVHTIHAANKDSSPHFGAVLSPDSLKLLLFFDPPYERKSSESISFACYNSELELLWDKEILLPYTQEMVQVHSFMIDNQANIFMMSGRNPSKSNRQQWKKPQGGRYVAFYYNAKENKLKEYDISLKEKQVLSVAFAMSPEQDVVITGYYSNDFHFSAAGTFLFAIGANGGVVKTAGFMPFSPDFLSKLLRAKDIDPDAALPDFFLDHMFIQKDSSITLVGEQYYVSEYIMTDPTTGRQTIEYRFNFDDIIVTRLEANGRHIWSKKIPKRQYTLSSSDLCSYQCFNTEEGIVFFFNDNPDNQKALASLPEGSASGWSGARNAVTTSVKMNNLGDIERSVVVSNREVGAMLKPNAGNPTCHGPQILGFDDGKNYWFCLVK